MIARKVKREQTKNKKEEVMLPLLLFKNFNNCITKMLIYQSFYMICQTHSC